MNDKEKLELLAQGIKDLEKERDDADGAAKCFLLIASIELAIIIGLVLGTCVSRSLL